MKNCTNYLASGIFALALSTAAASAATASFSALPTADTGVVLADAITGTVYEQVTDSVANVRMSAWNGTTLNGTGVYTSVSAGSSATYNLDPRSTRVSFLWGSPDDYNKVDFLLGGFVVDTFAIMTMTNIFPATYATLGATATIFSSVAFDAVRFSSKSNAFEYANVVAAVPVPAAGFLLFGALGGLAALRRRRKSV